MFQAYHATLSLSTVCLLSGTSLFLLSWSNAVDAILDVSSICLLLGGQFHLVADDDFYRTYAIKTSAEGYVISIQFENIRYGTVNIILSLLDSSLMLDLVMMSVWTT